MDPLSIARYGMMAAETRLAASAGRVAAGAYDDPAEVVEQLRARTEFAANARVAAVSDEMWRTLLDAQKD
jgi:hypothetical protein